MLSESEARQAILSGVTVGEAETVPLDQAAGRYLADDLRAQAASPLFDHSAMDGYAVRHEDARAGAELTVTGEQPAGRSRDLACGPWGAVRIFTGAPIPAGATAVVMQEDVEKVGKNRIRIIEAAAEGEFIRRAGGDLCVGQFLAAKGHPVTPGLIGTLASQGLDVVRVGSAPSISVVTTGDEVVSPPLGRSLEPGELFNSNGPMLRALVRRLGFAEKETVHVADDESAVKRVMEASLSTSDVLIVVGGVSVGDRDFVKGALDGAGVETVFWRVRVKPGKPFLFGKGARSLVFGLPGNPVSAFVSFHLFVAPALRKWMGASEEWLRPAESRCVLDASVANRGDRPQYVTGRVDRTTRRFVSLGIQQSHAIGALARADGMLRVEAGGALEAGAEVWVVEL